MGYWCTIFIHWLLTCKFIQFVIWSKNQKSQMPVLFHFRIGCFPFLRNTSLKCLTLSYSFIHLAIDILSPDVPPAGLRFAREV